MEVVVERSETGRADDPLIGRVLDGRYQIGEQVARGGMATVYQAQDLRLERTVAVKVMHANLVNDDEFVARFEREARSAARLSHHNVVSVFDQGDDRGTLYLVMEYVPGITLRDVIRRDAPMDPGRALELIEPVLAALSAAHTAGLIHRDVKPENVLIGPDTESGAARIKVADFGLARAINAETQHTATGGVLIGTVSYLSPELVIDGKADARSDVYAVGVLIYEMLTGVKPHQAENPIQVAYKHVNEDVPAPSVRVPGLPAYVDALVARATARDRDLRPADARVLLHQVRRVRQALDHGVVEDPELVADLLPNSRRDPDSVPTGIIDLNRDGARHDAIQHDEVYNHQLDSDYSDDSDFIDARYTDGGYAGAGYADAGLTDAGLSDAGPTDYTARVAVVPPPPVRRPPQPLGRAGSPTGPPSGRPPIAAEPGIDYRRPKRSRRGLYLLIGVLVAALLAGFTAWELGGHTTVPSVQGLSYADAKVKLEQAGLTIRRGAPEYTSSTGVPSGLILRTSPKPGDSVGDGNVVTVFVSLGPELSAVPSLSGQTLAAAISALTGARLQQGNVTERYSETAPAGTVIGSSPSAGSDQTLRTKVDLVVSKGRQPITIPDFTKKAGTTASTKLTALGFTVVMQQDFSDTVPTGMVISQTPNTGTGFKGDTITLTISKGVQLIEIPQLKRSTIGDATATLQGLGFVVVVHRSGYYVGANLVAGSDPPAGTLAPHGSTVTLTVV